MKHILLSFLILLVSTLSAGGQVTESRLVLRGGMVVDGSGRPPYQADIAIRSGRIEAVGSFETHHSDRILSIAGKVLSPGFIDLHNHSTSGLPGQPQAESQVSQGITTLLLGADGSSPFPVRDYLEKLEETGSAVNAGLMVGHGTVRSRIMTEDYKREASAGEIEGMSALVELAMRQGAFGLSSGLEYDPGFYSSTDELIALARVAARYGGFYMSHIRDEEDGFVAALEEAIQIGREADIAVQISHIKLGNTRVWGRAGEALDRILTARREGVEITADCYPYNAWASSLSILVPSRRFEDPEAVAEGLDKVGGAEKVLITRYASNPSFEFKTLAQLARQEQTSAVELYQDILKQGGASVVCESMNDKDVEAFYQSPWVMVASDGGIDSRHPRKAGTFPRVLGRFVRLKSLLTLEEAVRKMTSLPARRLGLGDRGRIEPGFWADLVVFDPERVLDRATFQEPDLLAEGIEMTLVNGVPVWAGGSVTGELPGKVLRR